jgi:hypothetical protein
MTLSLAIINEPDEGLLPVESILLAALLALPRPAR